MRACLPFGLMVLRTATSVSKSTCENDESFHDSYGWTCRDYERAPYQCIQSTKYAIGGETALTSCCACQENSEESIFALGDSGTEVSNKSPIRRVSDECLSRCIVETDSCTILCGTDKNTCQSRCSNVQATCDFQCELIEGFQNEDPDALITTEEETSEVTDNSSFMEMIYILIGVGALLGICCCGFATIYLIRNRVKTAVADPSPLYAAEQTSMVKPYAQDEGDWRGPDPYDPNNQISATPCEGGPVYNYY